MATALFGMVGPAHADDHCGEAYRPYAAMLLDRLVIGTEALAKPVETGDLAGARRAWVEARVGWRRGEPFITEYFPDADAAMDAWPDARSGFHAVERILFEQENLVEQEDVAAAYELTRRLVGEAATLQ